LDSARFPRLPAQMAAEAADTTTVPEVLAEAVARGHWPLPEDEWPAAAAGEQRQGSAPLAPSTPPAATAPLLPRLVERECARLRPRLLRAPRGLVELPVPYRRAGMFSLLAALRLLSEVEEAGAGLLTAAPHLSTPVRIGLLVRARWFGRFSRTRPV